MTINPEFMSGFYAGLSLVSILSVTFVLGRIAAKNKEPKKEELKK